MGMYTHDQTRAHTIDSGSGSELQIYESLPSQRSPEKVHSALAILASGQQNPRHPKYLQNEVLGLPSTVI